MELLKQGVPESDDEDWDRPHWLEENENGRVEEEDDSLENEDLTYITSILASFSKPKLNSDEESDCAIFMPEGAQTRVTAKQMTPPKFNQKFNQNLTIRNSTAGRFSCFPTILEEGPTEPADYSDEEEDNSLDNEDILSESEEGEVNFETQSELDTEETEEDPAFASIYCISQKEDPAFTAFAAWRPYIPPEPVFQSSSAQSWWSDSSPLASLSLELTLTRISSIKCSNSTIGQTPIPVCTTQNKIRMKCSKAGGHTSQHPLTTNPTRTGSVQNRTKRAKEQ